MSDLGAWAEAKGGSSTLLRGGRVLLPDTTVAPVDLLIQHGRIQALIPSPDSDLDGRSPTRVVDLDGLLVAPGLVDLQLNGGFAHDFLTNPESIWKVGAQLPRTGVTAFLPTIVSSPRDRVTRAQDVLGIGPPSGYQGAVPLGLHLEGPMLANTRAGAHQAKQLQAPAESIIVGWSQAGNVRMVTLAPELPGADRVIQRLVSRGVVVSAGHSDATYEEAVGSFEQGVSFGTHLFNAMSPLQHRGPGLVGALLEEDGPPVGVIVDGLHIHPAAVAIAWRLKGPDRFVLVSDAMSAMGMGHGSFQAAGRTITVDGRGPRTKDGILAGSCLTMDQAVRNLLTYSGCSPADALLAASTNPAHTLSDDSRGSIREGSRADLVILDSGLSVVATVVGGNVVYVNPTRGTPA